MFSRISSALWTHYLFPYGMKSWEFRPTYFADSASFSPYGLPAQQKKQGKEEAKAASREKSEALTPASDSSRLKEHL